MTKAFAVACPLAALLSATPASAAAGQQINRPGLHTPPPSGQRIVARDGDVVTIEGDARVRVVRRREANVRVIFNSPQRWLVVLADFAAPNGTDGAVDMTYTFNTLAGDWPLESRWEGFVTVEEYSNLGEPGNAGGLGIVTPQGLVQLLGQPNRSWFQDQNATVLTYRGAGRGGAGNSSFDEAEQRQIATAIRNADAQVQGSSALGFSSSMSFTSGTTAGGVVTSTGEQGPVRVGGTIRQPTKLVDVKPVYPEIAVRARVSGVVILELTIDVDGSVKEARVLRSIPLLDEAAITAARQWRYEPTLLNGRPVPIVLTATVLF